LREAAALPPPASLADPKAKAEATRKLLGVLAGLPPGFAAARPRGAAAPGPGAGAGGAPAAAGFSAEQVEDALRAIETTGGAVDYAGIGAILLTLLGLYLLSALFMFATQWIMSGVAQETVYELRKEVDAKLGRLPLRYFDSRPHGEILSRVTNDVETVATTLQQSVTQAITSVVQLAGFVVMMLLISPVLTLIVAATLPLYVFVTAFVAKKSQKYFAAQQKQLGAISGHIEETFSGHAVVKAYGRERRALAEFDGINGELARSGRKAQFVSGVMFPAMSFVSNLGYVLIAVVGGVWMTKGRLALGDITAFIQYSRSFTQPIMQTANIANIIQSTVACAERVFEVLDEAEELPDAADAVRIESPRGEVSVSGMAFSYKAEEPLIRDLSLEVKKGHTIAVVGPTGAGKTTLVNLLMRFYEIQAGSIRVDGADIRDLRRRDLRSMFGMVLQDAWLFNGTIRENIAYGRDGATEEEITRAARTAHADHFIRTLPEGYDTVLNEEASNISQGQKQLITIARAVLADPAILILDEATSSVDTRTEVLIQKAMRALMEGRTSFVIAHRLSTIRDAELILVMDKGSIVEQGTHAGLLAACGFYAELYRAQFAGAAAECA
ncbi:MAG: ABC transporter ATP-binding protein, partial [Spirochaetaceae bacterium]|nr:ABC transporter ATP-binding protein [Spirochaetaceae bacterium]